MSHQWSRSSVLPLTEYDLDTIDVVEVKHRIGELEKEVAEIDIENELFVRYLETNDPELLVGINKMMAKQKTATRIQFALGSKKSHETTHSAYSRLTSQQGSQFDASSVGTATSFNRSARTVDSQRATTGTQIAFAMRAELANKEAAAMRHNANLIETTTKAKCRDLIAEIEELRLSNEELIETRHELKEYVLTKGVNAVSKRVPSERLLKFFDTWNKNGNAMVAHMRLRTATLSQNCRRKQLQLAVKAELSGILRPIDFQQLEIEKMEFQQEIRDKTVHLLALKRTTGNASLALATQRKLLLGKEADLRRMQAEKERIANIKTKYENDSDVAQREIVRCSGLIDSLNELMRKVEAPSIDDYMKCKQELHDLEREIKGLKRSAQLMTVKLKNANRKWRQRQVQPITSTNGT